MTLLSGDPNDESRNSRRISSTGPQGPAEKYSEQSPLSSSSVSRNTIVEQVLKATATGCYSPDEPATLNISIAEVCESVARAKEDERVPETTRIFEDDEEIIEPRQTRVFSMKELIASIVAAVAMAVVLMSYWIYRRESRTKKRHEAKCESLREAYHESVSLRKLRAVATKSHNDLSKDHRIVSGALEYVMGSTIAMERKVKALEPGGDDGNPGDFDKFAQRIIKTT